MKASCRCAGTAPTARRTCIVTGFQQPGGGPNAQPRRASELQVSPDGDRVLAHVDNKIFVVPLPMTGGPTPTVSIEQPNNSAVPFRRLSRIGGDFLGWNADSKGVFYSLGRSFFQYDLARADSLAADSAAKAPPRPASVRDDGRTPIRREGQAGLRADADRHHDHGAEGPADRDASCCAARASSR